MNRIVSIFALVCYVAGAQAQLTCAEIEYTDVWNPYTMTPDKFNLEDDYMGRWYDHHSSTFLWPLGSGEYANISECSCTHYDLAITNATSRETISENFRCAHTTIEDFPDLIALTLRGTDNASYPGKLGGGASGAGVHWVIDKWPANGPAKEVMVFGCGSVPTFFFFSRSSCGFNQVRKQAWTDRLAWLGVTPSPVFDVDHSSCNAIETYDGDDCFCHPWLWWLCWWLW